MNLFSDEQLPGRDEEKFGIKGTGKERAIIDRLVELGSDVFLKNTNDGFPPVHIAACFGKAEVYMYRIDLQGTIIKKKYLSVSDSILIVNTMQCNRRSKKSDWRSGEWV